MIKHIVFLLAFAVGPSAVLAQGFPVNPGLPLEQERILNPIPLPPPGPTPSPPVPMIVPPAPVVSTPPPVTQFPGGSGPAVSPVDRRQAQPPATPAEAAHSVSSPAASPEPTPAYNGSKEIHWQTVTLPPAPSFGRNSGPSVGSEASAKTLIEADGYRRVTGLAMGADGSWHGKALRGNTEVAVSVDARGNVSAE